jgi:FkbM family methyltransferase
MDATKEDILACFRLLLGRGPEENELPDHFSRVGAPLETVVAIFVGSPEFHQRWLDDGAEIASLEGFQIYVARNDRFITPGIRAGCYEPGVTRAFLEHLDDGVVLDIGANCGYFSLLAASRGRTVYAFEPLQSNLRLLHAGVIQNNFSRLHIVAAAASDSRRTLAIIPSDTNGVVEPVPSGPQKALRVEYCSSVRVDDIVLSDDPVSILKIDVEGHEYRAILGAGETIRRSRPVILSEFSPSLLESNSGVSPASYLDLLRSFSYRISAIDQPDIVTNQGLLEFTEGVNHIDILAEPY